MPSWIVQLPPMRTWVEEAWCLGPHSPERPPCSGQTSDYRDGRHQESECPSPDPRPHTQDTKATFSAWGREGVGVEEGLHGSRGPRAHGWAQRER